jgi:hypothetical protein
VDFGAAPGGATRGTVSYNVTFGTTTGYLPIVVATIESASTNLYNVQITSRGQTGFSYAKYFTTGGSIGGASSEPFCWIAIGRKN